MIGDMVDNGLKNSKTNTYEQTMRPFEQKMYLKRMFKPLAEAGKILGMCRGNHEGRTSDLSDGCPLYDVASKLDVEDVYRENMVFMKVSLGQRTTERQATYTIVLGHGASKGRVDKFSYSIDGMDILITGHTHQGSSDFLSKIVIDPRNNVINHVGYAHIVVPSFAKIGGYALKAMYAPRDTKKIPVIRLSGEKKSVEITWRD
jgi:predicted phosphodiesterase